MLVRRLSHKLTPAGMPDGGCQFRVPKRRGAPGRECPRVGVRTAGVEEASLRLLETVSLVEGLPQSERLPRLLASLPDSVLAQLKRGSIRWLAETDWERLPEEEMESLFLMAVWSWRLVQEEPAGATAGLSARDAELAMLAIACCLIAESGRRRGARLSLPANPFHPAAMRALRAEMHREMGDFLSLPAAIALA